jgi:Tol biopolymer transport system component
MKSPSLRAMILSRRNLRWPAAMGLLVSLATGAIVLAKDRIFVDQWSPTRSELYVADTDGRNARKLVAGLELDYNASFSSDGEWVVFTSERYGSADIFRVRTSGMELERLTDHPAFDDQAALSPDGNSLAFVSTRDTGSTDIYILDMKTRQTRNLTNSPGGDYRPSWSPDGRRIAFSSDRGTKLQRSRGNWEQVQAASVYIIGADGRDLRKLSSGEGQFAGSPKWSPDGARVVFYELAAADTFRARGLGAQATIESRIVSVDVATGARAEHASGPGLKLSPQFLDANRIGYLAKSGASAALTFTSGEKGSVGDVGNPAWSRDGRRVVYHSGPIDTIPAARRPGGSLSGRDPEYELRFASGFPAVSPDGRHIAVSERTGRGNPDDRTALVVWAIDGTNPRRIFRAQGSLMSPQWSPDGQWIVFGAGSYFVTRASHPAQIMVVKPDGSGARALTTGPGNSGFPSWSPDGKQVVYRFWSDAAEGSRPNGPTPGRAAGLRIFNMSDGAVRTLTTGYDNFPCWLATGRIVFSRFENDEFHIFAISPDGTSLTQLTKGPYDDTHPACAPDGEHVLFSTSRFGFKDEAPMFDIPQPYGELIIMKADGSQQRALTDNRWEEGTPAWVPARAEH